LKTESQVRRVPYFSAMWLVKSPFRELNPHDYWWNQVWSYQKISISYLYHIYIYISYLYHIYNYYHNHIYIISN
jgi:hypothetical protein